MKVYDAASIRNVALVGHSGSGKTQLASAILSDAGMVNRFGKVDDGTTVTDYDEEEIARKHTLSAGLACAEWNRQKVNVIDTPGMGNFISDTQAALQVASGNFGHRVARSCRAGSLPQQRFFSGQSTHQGSCRTGAHDRGPGGDCVIHMEPLPPAF